MVDRVVRDTAVEKLFTAANGIDTKILFAAVNLLDRYFESKPLNFYDLNEAEITAMVALAVVIADEPEVPLNATLDLHKHLKGKFEVEFIEEREVKLRACLAENHDDIIYPLEFSSVLGSLLCQCMEETFTDSRAQVQVLNFLNKVEGMVIEYSKSVLLDAEL